MFGNVRRPSSNRQTTGVSRRTRKAGRPVPTRLTLEPLETRLLLTTYMVTNTNDAGDGSLRQAILDANANPGTDTIAFAIDSGPQTITPVSALPTITDPVILDGTTQPGNAGSPLIEIDGASAGANANGLRIAAGNSTVLGLVINRFGGNGILLETNGGNVVQGCYLGTDLAGTAALGNGLGLDVTSRANLIGGTTTGAGNLISGNRVDGMRLESAAATGNVVQANLIGTDASGTVALGNTLNGIVVTGPDNVIGGTVAQARNIASGNGQQGVYLNGAGATGNFVQGNFIGTDVAGTAALRNGLSGVLITGASNTIGGLVVGAGNVISGNLQQGISLNGAGAAGNVVQGNRIGTNAAGTAEVSNGLRGITASNSASFNLLGGTDPGAGNLLSGNLQNGMELTGDGTTGNVIQGNLIGTDVTGEAALPNHLRGVGISYGATGNTVGGTTAGARNLISGNMQNGVLLDADTDGNVVQGNFIGTDVAGTAAIPNHQEGVLLGKTSVAGPITNNLIGGTAPGAGNLIAGNLGEGVRIKDDQTSGNVVQGNLIGTDATGTTALPNGSQDVLIIQGATNNLIGGTDPGAGNVIAASAKEGVAIKDVGTTGNVVQGNFIGTDASATFNLGNSRDGVHLIDASDNTIGGTDPGAGNVIAYSGNDGVLVETGTGDAIQGNVIFASSHLGIELKSNGNNLQAFPVLTSGTTDGSSTTIQGTLQSAPDSTFTLEFFVNTVCNPSGYGEGEQVLGTWTVNTDDAGAATFTAVFAVGVSPGQFLSATATDLGGNTSQFAQCLQVTEPTAPGSVFSWDGLEARPKTHLP